MFDYDKAKATASRIISKYGSAGSVIRQGTTGGFDAGGNAKPDQPDYIISGVITPIIKYRTDEIDGTKILKGDGWCLFDSEETPEVNMTTNVNGVVWRIVDIDTLESVSGVVIRRMLQLRK